MGCSSNDLQNERSTEDNINSFEKLEKILKQYKEAISKYKKSVGEYEDIFEQQIKCEKLLKNYFSLQKNINLSNEPNEIKNYKKTFNRVNKLEDNLKISPAFFSKFNYNNKKDDKNLKETENISMMESEDDDNEKEKQKQKKKKKKK